MYVASCDFAYAVDMHMAHAVEWLNNAAERK